jgi:serine phosphatase RsbU (regulator of sigma subunit)/Tfp pilus assembly protein PilF
LLLVPIIGFSQLSAEEELYIDSLHQVIAAADHDSTVISAWIQWDNLIYYTDPELDLELNLKIDSLASLNLEKSLKEEERSFFLKTKAFAINVIGITHHNRGEYEEALDYYGQSLAIKQEIGDEMGMASSLGNIGLIHYEKGDYKEAIKYYSMSLEIEKKLGNKEGIAATYNNLGNLYTNQGDYAKAIEYHTMSLKIDEELGRKDGMASSLNNIGLIYDDQGDMDMALKYYKESLELEEELGEKKGIAYSYGNIGLFYEAQGDYEQAIEYLTKSLVLREEIEDKRGVADALNSLGIIYEKLKQYDKGIDYLQKSLGISKEIGDKKGIATSLNGLSLIYLGKGDLKKAQQYSTEALVIAQSVGVAGEISIASKSLWKVHKSLGKYKSSLEMFELYITTRDSILSAENEEEIIKQQYKYQYEKQAAADSVMMAEQKKVQEALLAAEKAENEQNKLKADRNQLEADQQQLEKYIMFGGLALALLFGAFIFNRFRVTRKQKDIIEDQKRTVDLAYNQLEEKNKEILDSITYAKRIQSAVLPPLRIVKEYLPNSFVFYMPKDIVAGDFYWLEHTEDKVMFAACDCTGHGVPGAMVSVVCVNGLNRSVREHGLTDPGEILNKTREIVVREFEKSEEEVKDGMDVALCVLEGNKLQYAGAHNPLWIIRKGANEVEEIKADNQPIGKFENPMPYTTNEVTLNPGDSIYIFSDGYSDQFGGESGKKFKTKNFKSLLLSVQAHSMQEQRELIAKAFEEWKGDLEQLDDVCVIGVRL